MSVAGKESDRSMLSRDKSIWPDYMKMLLTAMKTFIEENVEISVKV